MPGHKQIIKSVQLQWSKTNRGRLFENDCGQAWTGKCTDERMVSGRKLIELFNAYRISYGLEPGSSDLVGFEFKKYSVKDGETRIQKTVPIICSVEAKTLKYSTITEKQINWMNFLTNIGGFAYVARETKENYELIPWKLLEGRIRISAKKL